jgi:hypothetical protein
MVILHVHAFAINIRFEVPDVVRHLETGLISVLVYATIVLFDLSTRHFGMQGKRLYSGARANQLSFRIYAESVVRIYVFSLTRHTLYIDRYIGYDVAFTLVYPR